MLYNVTPLERKMMLKQNDVKNKHTFKKGRYDLQNNEESSNE